MDLHITSNKENRLLNRREIDFSIVQDGSTPSKNEIKMELCKKLNLDPESVIVVRIEQSTGVRQCHGIAHAYASKELVERSEPRYLVDRMKGIKKAKVQSPEKEEKAKEPVENKSKEKAE